VKGLQLFKIQQTKSTKEQRKELIDTQPMSIATMVKVKKIKLSLSLINHRAIKTYGGVEV
jgi:hypothetical protein